MAVLVVSKHRLHELLTILTHPLTLSPSSPPPFREKWHKLPTSLTRHDKWWSETPTTDIFPMRSIVIKRKSSLNTWTVRFTWMHTDWQIYIYIQTNAQLHIYFSGHDSKTHQRALSFLSVKKAQTGRGTSHQMMIDCPRSVTRQKEAIKLWARFCR